MDHSDAPPRLQKQTIAATYKKGVYQRALRRTGTGPRPGAARMADVVYGIRREIGTDADNFDDAERDHVFSVMANGTRTGE